MWPRGILSVGDLTDLTLASSAWTRFLRQFHQPLVYLLLIACAITGFLGEWVDSFVILGVVAINAMVGFLQEANTAVKTLLAEHAPDTGRDFYRFMVCGGRLHRFGPLMAPSRPSSLRQKGSQSFRGTADRLSTARPQPIDIHKHRAKVSAPSSSGLCPVKSSVLRSDAIR